MRFSSQTLFMLDIFEEKTINLSGKKQSCLVADLHKNYRMVS